MIFNFPFIILIICNWLPYHCGYKKSCCWYSFHLFLIKVYKRGKVVSYRLALLSNVLSTVSCVIDIIISNLHTHSFTRTFTKKKTRTLLETYSYIHMHTYRSTFTHTHKHTYTYIKMINISKTDSFTLVWNSNFQIMF